MSTEVILFTDYACPWCYLGRARLMKVSQPITVRTVHFPLSPDTPPEGRELRAYLKARGMDVDAATARLKALMDLEGLPWNVDPNRRSCNTRKAQELASWAEPKVGAAVHAALFDAYQVQGKNLYDDEVLVEVFGGLGIAEADVRAALAAQEGKAAVDRDWAWARQVGVSSVPTYAVGGQGVVGAQSVEVLERLVASGQAN